MSGYSNFVTDFPKRCDDVLEKFCRPAQARNREVTLMLATATAGFVVPFERLRPGRDHPARDRQSYEAAAEKLDAVLGSAFIDSALWGETVGSWVFAKEVQDEQRELDFWPELLSPKPLSRKKQAGSVLAHLRNALAHGNIFTRGNPIDLLVFLTKPHETAKNYSMLAVAPVDFYRFVRNWFALLASIRMPGGVFEGHLVA